LIADVLLLLALGFAAGYGIRAAKPWVVDCRNAQKAGVR
jgi:hypothetical protein